ncbi:MAG: nuclear transport factor 2 family protein [Phenylobacterium sp.]|jgi:limonene-1,2-epoxide hydrolase|nr:nuclear transport factor 2 family protein [Phenylobacterium sp.]
MSAPSDPAVVVDAFLAAMEAKDYAAATPYVAEDCRYENMNAPGTVHVGPAGVVGFLESFFAPISKNEFIALRRAAAGDVVFIERLDRHLFGTKWVELPVTGVFEVRDGKIVFYRDYFDAQVLTAQLAG